MLSKLQQQVLNGGHNVDTRAETVLKLQLASFFTPFKDRLFEPMHIQYNYLEHTLFSLVRQSHVHY